MIQHCRAWVQHGPRRMTLEELPLPEHLSEGEGLARVEASGICGSDVEMYRGTFDETGRMTYPYVMGHEPLLRIERLTPTARARWKVDEGDRVLTYSPTCGRCHLCVRGRPGLCVELRGRVPLGEGSGLWGSLAEYKVIPAGSIVYKVPDSVPVEDVLLYNPLSGGFEWVVARGGVGVGDDVLILGAGQRGLASVVASVQAGANRIIVSGLAEDEEKLKVARAMGATDTVVVDGDDPASLIDQIGAQVVDVAIEVVPVATRPVVDAIEAVRKGGTVVLAGIKGMRAMPEFVSDKVVFKSLDLRGALGYSPLSQQRAIDSVLSGRYDFADWHTHTFSLARAEEALQVLGGEMPTDRTPIHVTVMGS